MYGDTAAGAALVKIHGEHVNTCSPVHKLLAFVLHLELEIHSRAAPHYVFLLLVSAWQ